MKTTTESRVIKVNQLITLKRHVIDKPCSVIVCLHETTELSTLSTISDISIEEIMDISTGQLITASMLDPDEIKSLLVWIKTQLINL